jgi:hypothetical protein
MTKRRLMQAILAFALFGLSRSPNHDVKSPSRRSDRPSTPVGRFREALLGTGLIPAALAKVVTDKQGTSKRHKSR